MRTVDLLVLLLPLLLTGCREDAGPIVPESVYAKDQERDLPRYSWQKPGVVLDAMGDVEEKVIADIGAGEGFFAKRLAPLADRVIAVEIDPTFVDYLDTLRRYELPEAMRGRLEPRLGTATDPRLANNEVDIVLIVNTIHVMENPEAYLRRLMPALRGKGRIVIVDWKKRQTTIGPAKDERVALARLEEMIARAGYRVVSSDDTSLEYQYILVAEK